MHYVLYALDVLLMLVMPLALATFIARRLPAAWGLFGMGAATFVAAQLFHVPFNLLVQRSAVLPDPAASRANLVVV
ncbi:MAG TPA: hypothetical protein VE553_06255, partial [Candidatus Binatia bacterium]|nr:hypothetical protein [Candidatus Binatia bacterium]